ncbi:MAG: hypothetical protein QM777_05980 [Pseudorhodoferax sp.]
MTSDHERKTTMLQRRTLLWTGLAGTVLPAWSAELSAAWLLGHWRSDAERTLALWRFQDTEPSPRTRQRLLDMFGQMRWTVEPQRLIASDARTPDHREVLPYRVVGATSSSLSLRFVTGRPTHTATLFRQSEDVLFMRVGRNFEFFARVRG